MTTPEQRMDQELPVGTVLAYAGKLPADLVELGWLWCDGSSRLRSDYPELHDTIGFTFGAVSRTRQEFNLPDLRGVFVRATSADEAIRSDRDPEWRERVALMEGGEVGAGIGSYQSYGTAKPVGSDFTSTVNNLDISKANYDLGATRTPAKYNSDTVVCHVTGGDLETRPVNKYVHYIIKASRTRSDGAPVVPPVGATVPFAGPPDKEVPAGAVWQRCTGEQVSRVGAYFELYKAIGFAHGGEDPEFRLPDYRGSFLRGVSGTSERDPERNTRFAAATGGNVGNAVGSAQGWSTATPQHPNHLLYASLSALPREDDSKGMAGAVRDVAYRNPGSVDVTLKLDGTGNAESRPANVSVDFYIRIADTDADFPVGAIAMVGADLPDNPFWLPCDGRLVAEKDYPELLAAIGVTYGLDTERDLFGLPDYRGRFLRGASYGTGADPEAAQRRPLGVGAPDGVGSLQPYATGRPQATDFKIVVPHLPTNTFGTHGELRKSAVKINGGKRINVWDHGGNADTRPENIYLTFYIRAR